MKPNPEPPKASSDPEAAKEAPTYIIRRLEPATVDDLKRTRVVLRREISGAKIELEAKIDNVKTELDAKIDGLRMSLKINMRWMMAVVGIFGTLTIGLLLFLITKS